MSSMTHQRHCPRTNYSSLITRPAASRARYCCCRSRSARLQGTAPIHPNGSTRNGSPRPSGHGQAVWRSGRRTRSAGHRPTACSQPDARPVARPRSCRERAPQSHRARQCVAGLRSRSVPSPWPDHRNPATRASSKTPVSPGNWWISTRPASCRLHSRRTAECRSNCPAASWRGYVRGPARSGRPPRAVASRPMAGHRAQSPRSIPAWSGHAPGRAPARRSHRRISV